MSLSDKLLLYYLIPALSVFLLISKEIKDAINDEDIKDIYRHNKYVLESVMGCIVLSFLFPMGILYILYNNRNKIIIFLFKERKLNICINCKDMRNMLFLSLLYSLLISIVITLIIKLIAFI